MEASLAASAFCAGSEAVPELDKAGSSDDCSAIGSVRASTSCSVFGDSVMGGSRIGVAIAGEDDADFSVTRNIHRVRGEPHANRIQDSTNQPQPGKRLLHFGAPTPE